MNRSTFPVQPNSLVTYRPGTGDDSYDVFLIFEKTLANMLQRAGSNVPTSIADPEALANMWEERQSLYIHLAQTADQFWVAEKEGQMIGFARSIVRAGVRQLTELFVLPDQQSGGVGRELMARTFPLGDTAYRLIIASADPRAQVLYLKSGIYPRFPVYYFGRQPENVRMVTDLIFEPISSSPEIIGILGKVDETVLGYRRDVDHTWLMEDRQGYIYHRDDQPVGYGYLGGRNGPFALLDVDDFPAVLAHAENLAVASGREHFGVEVPMVNRVVVDYLLARGFRLDLLMAVMMTNEPFGRFENYILTSPPFFN